MILFFSPTVMNLKTLLKIIFKFFILLGLQLALISCFGLKTICSTFMPTKEKFLITITIIITIAIII